MKLPVVVLALLCSPLMAAENPGKEERETAVVISSEPPNALWNAGSLLLVTNDNEETALTMSFRMPRGKFTALVLSAKDWTLDLTAQASRLDSPWPARAHLSVWKVDETQGKLQAFRLSLPYGWDDCRELKFEIVDGRVSQTLDTDLVAPQMCGP